MARIWIQNVAFRDVVKFFKFVEADSLSALIFEKLSLKIEFEELDFLSSLNWIFTACVAWKIQV